MNMYRKAAVFLHGLAAADRDWLLARLNEPQRNVLDGLLKELCALGIPQIPTILAEVGRLRFEDRDEAPLRAGAPAHIAALASATAEALWLILEHQPNAVVSAVMLAEAWPWHEAILELMPASRRESVEGEAAVRHPPTSKTRDALLRTVARRLPAQDDVVREQAAGTTRPRRSSWWTGRRRLSWQP